MSTHTYILTTTVERQITIEAETMQEAIANYLYDNDHEGVVDIDETNEAFSFIREAS
jgi:hypothetical protein